MPKEATILSTFARCNPLTRAHVAALKTLLLNPSRNPQDLEKVSSLIFLGGCDANRNLAKNPLSYEQRMRMIMTVAPQLTEWNFTPYLSTPEGKSNPPSLDGMIRQIKESCAKRNIKFESLKFVVPFKQEEDGHDVVIEGKLYKNTHQLIATAQHYGLEYETPELQKENGTVINATSVRKDLAGKFHLIPPAAWLYFQSEMLLSILNQRPIGTDQSGDKYKLSEAEEATKQLFQENRVVGFDQKNPGMAEVVEVPQERRRLFTSYLDEAAGISMPKKSDTVKISAPKKSAEKKPENLNGSLKQFLDYTMKFDPKSKDQAISLFATSPIASEEPPTFLKEALAESIDSKTYPPITSYASCDMKGVPQLRQTMMQHFAKEGFNTTNCDTLFTHSIVFGFGLMADSILQPNDTVLSTIPTYSSFTHLLHHRHINVEPTELTKESDYKLTPEILHCMLEKNPEAKLLIFVNPDNPSGKIYSKEELQKLSEVFIEHNNQRKAEGKKPLIVFADEVSKNISLSPNWQTIPSIGANPGMEEFTCTASSISKDLAPGLRLSYLIGPQELTNQMLQYSNQDPATKNSAGPSQTSQFVGIAMFGKKNEEFQQHCIKRSESYRRNVIMMKSLINELEQEAEKKFGPHPEGKKYAEVATDPDAGLQCLITFPGLKGMQFPANYKHIPNPQKTTIENSLDLAWYFMSSSKVKTAPGENFFIDGDEMMMRLAISRNPEEIMTAFSRFKQAILALHSQELSPNTTILTKPGTTEKITPSAQRG